MLRHKGAMAKFYVLLLTFFITKSAFCQIVNFAKVDEQVYRGAWLQNGESDFKDLSKVGIKTIINMQYIGKDDPELCHKYGMSCEHYPIMSVPYSWAFINYDPLIRAYKRVKSLKENSSDEKVYVHCFMGSDRTGALISALEIGKRYCSKEPFDKAALRTEINQNLTKHSFHQYFYPMLYHAIMSWVDNPPAWLCE